MELSGRISNQLKKRWYRPVAASRIGEPPQVACSVPSRSSTPAGAKTPRGAVGRPCWASPTQPGPPKGGSQTQRPPRSVPEPEHGATALAVAAAAVAMQASVRYMAGVLGALQLHAGFMLRLLHATASLAQAAMLGRGLRWRRRGGWRRVGRCVPVQAAIPGSIAASGCEGPMPVRSGFVRGTVRPCSPF